jgi:hypothetical protein
MESHEAGFPPFPLLLEIPSGFPHSQRFDDGIDLSRHSQKQLISWGCHLRKGLVTHVPVHSFVPSLVSRINSYSVDRSIEATAYPSLKGKGPRSSRIGLGHKGGWVPAPDFSPGERVFKPARTHSIQISGFSPGGCFCHCSANAVGLSSSLATECQHRIRSGSPPGRQR